MNHSLSKAGNGQHENPSITTPAGLASIVKSCRDIMRKDKGLNGDLDRLPQLTWILFLKFLDDLDLVAEQEVVVGGRLFVALIDSPYRWRDWASKPDGITGDALISFVNNDEATRPDGTRGLGLLAYLKTLQGVEGGGGKEVISNAFRGVTNRMLSGYLLRDVLNRINEINFSSSEEVHTLSFIYEALLRELRDAAGDSGEFYTPRPLVKFMVKMADPQLGETILDPAAGTGGFLVESFLHLKDQCKTAEQYQTLQRSSLYGIEAKSLPYLLCQMNLLLHGVEHPNLDPLNALRFPLNEIGDRDRVDVVLTNPPFGGEEEKGILSNFPEDKRTNETALLFLQLVMRKLRRPSGGRPGGRCAMVVPDGTLFAAGIGTRIKKQLVEEFNLHTIVRLSKGVFAPYTGIETNLLFFERNGPTREIWYYELPPPPERQELENPCYTKTRPLRYEEFEPLQQWWNNRQENEHAWKVTAEQIAANDYNLDVNNPNSVDETKDLTTRQIVELIEELIDENMGTLEQIKREL